MKELEIVVATNNNHKLNEYKNIFSAYPNVILKSLNDEKIDIDPEENGKTFKENSLIKAKAIANFTNKIVLADDSGLEIRALDGFPGIYSSRFMHDKPYIEKCQAIFDMLKDKPREAQFHCVITLLNLVKEPLQFEGIATGVIDTKITGTHGFGYDPIFICDANNKSFASLSEEEKNKVSHRALATASLLKYLKDNNYI